MATISFSDASRLTEHQRRLGETGDAPFKKRLLATCMVPPSHHTGYLADDPPYLKTTECGQVDALHDLFQRMTRSNGVLLGFANEFNYNILAIRPMEGAIICDINKRMHTFYEWVANNIKKYDSPEEFLQALKSEIDSNPKYYLRFPATSEELITHYQQDFMWTSNVTSYQKVREMYMNGQIIHSNLDLINDSAYFDYLRRSAEQNGYVFDSVYVSNIFEWAERSGGSSVNKAKENLLKILSPDTLFIDAKQEFYETGEPKLRITTGIKSLDDFPSFKPSRKRKATTDSSSTTERITGLRPKTLF